MVGRPAAADLLDEARRTLLEVLLPLLAPDRRYDCLMVANAMAIAARDARHGPRLLREEVSGLASLLAASAVAESHAPSQLHPLLMELARRLAQEIRRGDYDAAGQRREAVRRHLRESVERRLRLSNPKALSE
jgi:hypothetical protein